MITLVCQLNKLFLNCKMKFVFSPIIECYGEQFCLFFIRLFERKAFQICVWPALLNPLLPHHSERKLGTLLSEMQNNFGKLIILENQSCKIDWLPISLFQAFTISRSYLHIVQGEFKAHYSLQRFQNQIYS